MSHVIRLSDAAFAAIAKVAADQGQSPEDYVELWALEQARDPLTHPHYMETDEWFRHLGASEDLIKEAKSQADQKAY